jgi:hypothetical protein
MAGCPGGGEPGDVGGTELASVRRAMAEGDYAERNRPECGGVSGGMGSRSLVPAMSVILIAGCTAGPMATPVRTADAHPATRPAAVPAGQQHGGAPASMPGTIRAALLRSTSGPGILPPGAPVNASDVGPRAAATDDVIFGLADQGGLLGETYPAISTDSGQHWQIDGPRFAYAAAQGASTTTSIGARGPAMAWAWGNGGNFVKVTTDGGRLWWSADFPAGVYSVTWRQGRLQVRALGDQTVGGQFPTFLYISPDNGRTWDLLSRLGNVPY